MRLKRIHAIMFAVSLTLLFLLIPPIYVLIGFLSGILPAGLAVAIGMITLLGATVIATPPLSRKLNRR